MIMGMIEIRARIRTRIMIMRMIEIGIAMSLNQSHGIYVPLLNSSSCIRVLEECLMPRPPLIHREWHCRNYWWQRTVTSWRERYIRA